MADLDNPFAPGADPVAGGDAPDAQDNLDPAPMDVGELLSRAWYLLQNNVGVVAAAILIPGVISFGFDLVNELFSALMDQSSDEMAMVYGLASLATALVDLAIAIFFSLGAIRIYLHVTRGQAATVDMLWGEARSIPSALGAYLIGGFLLFLTMLPFGAIAGAAAAGAMGQTGVVIAVVVAFAAMLYPWLVISIVGPFVPYAIVDQQMGPVEAIYEALRLTEGYKVTIFGVTLLAGIGAAILVLVTCGLGAIAVVPTLALLQGVMYHSLRHYQNLASDW